MAGWPAREVLQRVGEPGSRVEQNIPNWANFRHLLPTHSLTREAEGDPLSEALEFAGAAIVI